MSTQNCRSAFTSSLTKRQASSSDSLGKVTCVAKKRAPLGNITNQRNASQLGSKGLIPASSMVPFASKVPEAKNIVVGNETFSKNILPTPAIVESASCKNTSLSVNEENLRSICVASIPCRMDVSPSRSDGNSVSTDESMSSSDSIKSPDVEYIGNNNVPVVGSIDRKTFSNLHISDQAEPAVNICNREKLGEMETNDKIVNLDDNIMDPQLCANFACDIYKHLLASEVKKRPLTNFMETIQKDINPSMRAILIDWLVEVAEEYRLVPDTLYLTVNYIDRYLSGNVINRQRLQLLGVSSMMIAAKYEEICAPQVEEFCYITDNTFFREEVLEMESSILDYLKFEMTAPTAKCFLRRFVRAAQDIDEVPSLHLECLANYVTELSLLEYNMLCYAPSVIAASAIFLAKYVLLPSKRPWNSTLQHYTHYQPSDLMKCVKDLHRLFCNSHSSTLPSIREKYSQHKYKYVAKKPCPTTIPAEYFGN